MCARSIGRWLAAGAVVWAALAVPPARADDPKGDLLRRQAEQLEKACQWERACEVYAELLGKGRPQPETVKQRYQHCLRHVHRIRRHQDPTFRRRVLNRDLTVALKAYGEVLTKLRANYVERNGADLTRLFREGLEELRLSLDDALFLREHLQAAAPDAVRSFRAQLGEAWGGEVIRQQRDAPARVLEVALAAQRSIGLKPVVTVLEFTCGACNALDEHTAYLTPGQLAELYATLEGKLAGEGNEVVPSVVRAEMVPHQPGVGYIQLVAFQKTSPDELTGSILQLEMQGMKVLVLDLRGNPGGLFEAAVQTVERFLEEGVIVSTQSQVRAHNRTYEAHNPAALAIPLVVLIDGETASAAEVVAGALKDHKRATLVGQATYGKGSIQCVLELKAVPAGIRVTFAKFFSPSGHAYQGAGVAPHVDVERTSMAMAFDEAQAHAAVQEAARLLALRR